MEVFGSGEASCLRSTRIRTLIVAEIPGSRKLTARYARDVSIWDVFPIASAADTDSSLRYAVAFGFSQPHPSPSQSSRSVSSLRHIRILYFIVVLIS